MIVENALYPIIKWANKAEYQLREKNAIYEGVVRNGMIALASGTVLSVIPIFINSVVGHVSLVPVIGMIALVTLVVYVASAIIIYVNEQIKINQENIASANYWARGIYIVLGAGAFIAIYHFSAYKFYLWSKISSVGSFLASTTQKLAKEIPEIMI